MAIGEYYCGLALKQHVVWFQNKMADESTAEMETTQSALALDSSKQKEFENKIKMIPNEVSRILVLDVNHTGSSKEANIKLKLKVFISHRQTT